MCNADAQAPTKPMGSAKECFQEAKTLFELHADQPGCVSKAKDLCEKALAANSKHARAIQLLGMIAWREKRLPEAEELLHKAIALKPEDGHVKTCLAVVRNCAGAKEDEVIKLFREAMALVPDSATIMLTAASYYQNKERLVEAHELLKKAVAMDPDSAAGHYKLGKCLQRMQRLPEAKVELHKALTLDPSHTCASFWHAAVSGELGEVIDVPSAAPGDYVAKLFDGYADRFDDHLVNALGYQTPRLLMERVRGALTQGHSAASSAQALMFDHAMDLGCGTGLSGEALRPLVSGRMAGIDLSSGMLDKAKERQIYQGLYQGDLIEVLVQQHEQLGEGACYDFFFAADVLVYLGDVRPLFATCRSLARPTTSTGAPTVFAFSTEAWMGEESKGGAEVGYKLQPTGRYAHRADYLRATAEAEGWKVLSLNSEAIRQQKGLPLIGHLVVMQAV